MGGRRRGGAAAAADIERRLPRWAWALPVVAAAEVAALVIGLIVLNGDEDELSGVLASPSPAATVQALGSAPPGVTAGPTNAPGSFRTMPPGLTLRAGETLRPAATAAATTPPPAPATNGPTAAPTPPKFVTVVASDAVAANKTTYSTDTRNVKCPAGYVAVGGGVKNSVNDDAQDPGVLVISSAPLMPNDKPISDLADGSHPAPVGWSVTVINGDPPDAGNASRSYKVAVTCIRALANVTTKIAKSEEKSTQVSCPAGKFALGGGVRSLVEPGDDSLLVASSAPLLANQTDIDAPSVQPGLRGAPVGWTGAALGEGDPNYWTAAVCVTTSKLRTQVASASASAGHDASSATVVCPSDRIALSGGVKNAAGGEGPWMGTSAHLYAGGKSLFHPDIENGQRGPARGWDVAVWKASGGAVDYRVAAVCLEV